MTMQNKHVHVYLWFKIQCKNMCALKKGEGGICMEQSFMILVHSVFFLQV